MNSDTKLAILAIVGSLALTAIVAIEPSITASHTAMAIGCKVNGTQEHPPPPAAVRSDGSCIH